MIENFSYFVSLLSGSICGTHELALQNIGSCLHESGMQSLLIVVLMQLGEWSAAAPPQDLGRLDRHRALFACYDTLQIWASLLPLLAPIFKWVRFLLSLFDEWRHSRRELCTGTRLRVHLLLFFAWISSCEQIVAGCLIFARFEGIDFYASTLVTIILRCHSSWSAYQ